MMRCLICNSISEKNLCLFHERIYAFDKKINGFRLKKIKRGSRYTTESFHGTEIRLTKILEKLYGKKNIVTSFHPLWAVGTKGTLLEYDILIKSKNLLIEYNGQQHYVFTRFFHKNRQAFYEQQQRDRLKNKLAKNNGYNFIIFKFDEPIFKDYVLQKIEEMKE